MAKRTAAAQTVSALDFAFFVYLRRFYELNRGTIRTHYKDLSKKFLDFNDPENAKSYLRVPQFEALEIYVFLKEFADNPQVHDLFDDWYHRRGRYADRREIGLPGELQLGFLDTFDEAAYKVVFKRMKAISRAYPNYIFALTMGTGKTILMATCIFYEFILANKFPKDRRFCHNALVFAPDRTVLQSLKEIQTFDMALVVPPEYVNFLRIHIQFHFLEEAGTTLNTLDRSRFNLVVSNTQKIILKRQHAEKTATAALLGAGPANFDANSVYGQAADLYGFDQPEDEADLTTNQRFEKLRRLEQIGIYVDEAHHAFGKPLAQDVGAVEDNRKTSLRNTIDILAKSLERSRTHVVACYNYTGTPYVGQEILPEVVYAYGLKTAIDNQYLKQVALHGYTATRDVEFVDVVVKHFLDAVHGLRPEGMLPKLAFFAATIKELQEDLRPAMEAALIRYGVPTERILVNVGDDKLTTNDDIRAFNQLDTPQSDKQFILLVNKGREGWNCRSLFGVAMFREPKSKIFVLQATMRCLRQIGDIQHTGQVYLGHGNLEILNDELQQNFRISAEQLNQKDDGKRPYDVRVVTPPRTLSLRRIHRQFALTEKAPPPGFRLGLADIDMEPYKLIHTVQHGLDAAAAAAAKTTTEDLSHLKRQRVFSALTLVAEISRYLNKPCLSVSHLLEDTEEGTAAIVAKVNEANEVLYEHIIPRLFHAWYDIDPSERTEEYEVQLVKIPSEGYYRVSAHPDLVVEASQPPAAQVPPERSFHLDTYAFDSNPERDLFWQLLNDGRIRHVYFTGMLTHGQSEFFVQYIDPNSHTVRSYYPDFLFQKEDGTWVIVEVKGAHQVDDPVVLAKKDFAEQMASASRMTYRMISDQTINAGGYQELLDPEGDQCVRDTPRPQVLGL